VARQPLGLLRAAVWIRLRASGPRRQAPRSAGRRFRVAAADDGASAPHVGRAACADRVGRLFRHVGSGGRRGHLRSRAHRRARARTRGHRHVRRLEIPRRDAAALPVLSSASRSRVDVRDWRVDDPAGGWTRLQTVRQHGGSSRRHAATKLEERSRTKVTTKLEERSRTKVTTKLEERSRTHTDARPGPDPGP
jgi:hypothetical protein